MCIWCWIFALMKRLMLVLMFGWLALDAAANETDTTLAWQPQWHIRQDGKWALSERWQQHHVGYFLPPRAPGGLLIIQSRSPFSVWIDTAFAAAYTKRAVLSLDSLRLKFGSGFWVGVRTRDGLGDLQLELRLSRLQVAQPFFQPVPARDLRDFVTLVTLLLCAYALVVWRISPRLFYEYFNVFRIVSTRERDETQLLRITSSQNILYYFFLGAWWSFLGVLLAANDSSAAIQLYFPTVRFADLMLNWIVLTVLIVALLFIKYALQLVFSGMYAVLDHAADQFFTFVRLCFLVISLVSLWMFGSYLFEISVAAPYPKAIVVLLLFSLLSILFMQIRLMKGTSFRMFHIFSYLCVTEVIPLLVTFRFLYY